MVFEQEGTVINLETIIVINHKLDPTSRSEKRIRKMTEDVRDTLIIDSLDKMKERYKVKDM